MQKSVETLLSELIGSLEKNARQSQEHQKQLIAATIASAIHAANDVEAANNYRDALYRLFPQHGSGDYQAWIEKTKAQGKTVP